MDNSEYDPGIPAKMKHMTRRLRLTPKSNVNAAHRRARFHSSGMAPVHLLHPKRTFPNLVRRASQSASLGIGLRQRPSVTAITGGQKDDRHSV